jgi:hypothetical protein
MSLTKVSYSMVQGAPINILDYGASPSASASANRIAIQAAITAGGSNCNVYFPAGNYAVDAEITIANDRVNLIGAGKYATTITFQPTANSTCFKFVRAATTSNQGSICDLAIRSDDNTYVKFAMHFVDVSGYKISNVVIGGGVAVGNSGFWTDPTYSSYGIYIQGRDTTSFNDITVFADKPIVVAPNPNGAIEISIDHFNFNNCYLGATYNPCIIFTTGVVATQVSFTGYQAWVLGEGGFYWVDATTPGASNGLSFQNVRYENNRDQSTYFIHIDVASGVQNVQVSGGQFGYTNGFYLRGINQISLNSVFYSEPGTSGVAMNANATCQEINLNGCYWTSSSTASLTGLQIQHNEASWTSGPLPGTGYLLNSLANSGTYNELFETTLGSKINVLAIDAVLGIGSVTTTGLFVVTSRNNTTALYSLNGGAGATTEISDASGLYSITAGNAGTLNIYWSGGNSRYEIQNKIGSEQTIQFLRVGRGQ